MASAGEAGWPRAEPSSAGRCSAGELAAQGKPRSTDMGLLSPEGPSHGVQTSGVPVLD